ncbi:MAG: MaoC family dehydratase N-terminal domain-containing protein [Lautropia sp.]|nr:MaoC family dehydratase N-terminal domain-containing protein [Lautropia sp.]
MSEQPLAIDIDHLRTWIGREECLTDVVSVDLVQKFNATLDLSDEPVRAGDVAPLLIHFCLAPPVVATRLLGHDGHPRKGGFLPPVPLPRRMWAGGRFEFHGDLRVGDPVSRMSRIVDVQAKQGRTGPLCFVTVEHRLSVDGRLVLIEGQDIVYLEPATPATVETTGGMGKGADSGHAGPAAATTTAAAAAASALAMVDSAAAPNTAGSAGFSRRMPVGPTLLFRYSALTFNGHRIHYDQPFAVHSEHYPGLVVHGPMQATWLIHHAQALKGRRPSRFFFRSQAPLFDNDEIWIHAGADGDDRHLRLWTSRAGSGPAMVAEAVWA